MALTQTLAQLRTRVRQLADIESDNHVSDSELNGLINNAIRYVTDLLVNEAPDHYYSTTVNVSPSIISTGIYPISTLLSGTDFYKLQSLYTQEQQSWRMLNPLQDSDLAMYRVADNQLNLRIVYVPLPTTLSGDSDTFDGINGWEDLVVVHAAIRVKMKREESPKVLMAEREELEARVRRMSPRDIGHPRYVMRNKRGNRTGWAYPGSAPVDAYIVRGSNIEFYRYNGIVLRAT